MLIKIKSPRIFPLEKLKKIREATKQITNITAEVKKSSEDLVETFSQISQPVIKKTESVGRIVSKVKPVLRIMEST